VVEVNSTAGKAYFDALHAGQDFEQQAGDGGGRCVAAGGIEGVEDLARAIWMALRSSRTPSLRFPSTSMGGAAVNSWRRVGISHRLGAQSRCVHLAPLGMMGA